MCRPKAELGGIPGEQKIIAQVGNLFTLTSLVIFKLENTDNQ